MNQEEPRSYVSARRVGAMAILIVVSLVILSTRLYDLQVVNGAYYRELAEENRILRLPVSADRGLILDRNGVVLARNVPGFAVSVLPADIRRQDEAALARRIGALIGHDSDEIQAAIAAQRIRNPYEPVKVSPKPIGREVALLLAERAEDFVGVSITAESIRQYENGPLYSALIGYTGPITETEYLTRREAGYLVDDHLGRTGLERIYEEHLRGTYGWRDIERDAAQRELRELAAVPSTPGSNVVLSLDDRLQKLLAAELNKGIEENRYTQAVGLAMNPQNGEVLAMVTLPGYDNNMFIRGITTQEMLQLNTDDRRPLVNKAISEIYPPGSTYKMVTGLAALNEGVASRGTTVNVTSNVLDVGGFKFFDWRAHGLVNFIDGFAYSSDIYFYTLGGGNPYTGQPGVGAEKLSEYARLLGFGAPTGIDLPGEEVGILPDPAWKLATFNEEWTLGNTYHASIGQGYVAVTPLQLLNAYAALANGGTLYEPQLFKEAVGSDGLKTVEAEPKVIRELPIEKENLRLIREASRKVVTSGMAFMPNAKLPVAGKTGTAEFGPSTGKDSAGRNLLGFHNWFASWVPSADGDGTDAKIAMVVFTFNSSLGACPSCVSPAVEVTQRVYEAYYDVNPR